MRLPPGLVLLFSSSCTVLNYCTATSCVKIRQKLLAVQNFHKFHLFLAKSPYGAKIYRCQRQRAVAHFRKKFYDTLSLSRRHLLLRSVRDCPNAPRRQRMGRYQHDYSRRWRRDFCYAHRRHEISAILRLIPQKWAFAERDPPEGEKGITKWYDSLLTPSWRYQ